MWNKPAIFDMVSLFGETIEMHLENFSQVLILSDILTPIAKLIKRKQWDV